MLLDPWLSWASKLECVVTRLEVNNGYATGAYGLPPVRDGQTCGGG